MGEPLGGIAEKILPLMPFLPAVMRVFLPGALAFAILFPFIPFPAELMTGQFNAIWRPLALLVSLWVIALGALISALTGEIYKVYEGRILWPKRLFVSCKARQQRLVKKLLEMDETAKAAKDDSRRAEVWYRLRRFPSNDQGARYASHPTLLGNILAEYEGYPKSRYGMDSVFFWPRIWLAMDKEKKKEVDASWSVAAGFLNLSAVSFGGGILWLVIAALRSVPRFRAHLPFSAWTIPVAGGLLLLMLGYFFYRVSLPNHRAYGETFKAIFDLYRDGISAMTNFGTNESAIWEGTWAYLQYLLVSCTSCGTHFQLIKDCCPSCGCPKAISLRELKRQGVEPTRS